MDRRIFGVETEYGITCAGSAGAPSPLNAEAAARELFEPLVRRSRSTNLFLENGGRLYLDVGAHPEYATAECDNLWDLLAQDRAGAQLLAQMAGNANQELGARGIPGKIHLFRNNLDYEGNSFGCHENYLLRRRRDFREVADALVAFLVTRQILVGSGCLAQDEAGEWRYRFSSRSDQMWDAISASTTRARPIINTRDEPLANAADYRRLHVIVGDSNMAEPTTALKVGSMQLLLNAIDRGMSLRDLALEAPLQAIRDINWDLSGQLPIEMATGRRSTAVQIQSEILERVLAFTPAEERSELDEYLLGLWERTLVAIDSGDWEPISTEIDYAIKKNLLDQYARRSGATWDDPRIARLFLAYHDITDRLQDSLEASGAMVRLTSKAQVEQACTEPPATTRAALRGRALAVAATTRRDLGADWVHLRLEGEPTMTVSLQDPFASTDSQVDALIAVMEEHSARIPQ